MILAHLADLHLGYRAYHRLGPGGINARERDIAQSFRAAIERVTELGVDLVLIAGDFFHGVRPSNAAITDAFRQLLRLRNALPSTPVIIIAGNHDSPRSVEAGSILRLFGEIPGVHVVDEESRVVHLGALDTSVLCVPHLAVARGGLPAFEPDASAVCNLLMLHGKVVGGVADQKLRFLGEYGGGTVQWSDVHPERWDYVALGHYHIAEDLAPNVWYAGAIERTSNNIWDEAEPKVFLTHDTATAVTTKHELPTRDVVDLPRIACRSAGTYLGAAEVQQRIDAHVQRVAGGIVDRIVRLVIHDIPRETFRELDHRQLREYRAQALHFHLDARRPESRRLVTAPGGRRATLEEELESFLRNDWEPTSTDVELDRLVDLARRYLAAAVVAERGAADAEPA